MYSVHPTHSTKRNPNTFRFGSSQGAEGFLGAVGRASHTPTNLPTDFLDSLSKDLNGSFEYRNTPLGDGVSDIASK